MQQTLDKINDRLNNTLKNTDFPELGKKYEGKVRDNYVKDDRRIIITTDRVSTFDVVLGTIPFKGQVLNQIANFWFHKTEDIVRNHVVAVPDPNVLVVSEANAYPVEVVVRSYLTGSAWRSYQKGDREISGIKIPDGMKFNQKFEFPIITPSTKEEKGKHDIPISSEDIVKKNLVPEEAWKDIENKALKLFKRGSEIAAKQGLILVDTKYEFGFDERGLLLIDEIHTQDSSRYWISSEYDDRFDNVEEQHMLDKEYLRQWCIKEGFMGEGTPPKLSDEIRSSSAKKYIEAFEKITGEPFRFYDGNITERIRRNLAENGYFR